MRLFAGTPFDRPPTCERCGVLEAECQCAPLPPPAAPRIPPNEQLARLTVDRRRKGKTVTLVQGLPPAGNDLRELLGQLQARCGAGGTLHGETLEIQGDQRVPIRQALEKLGYRVQG